MFKNRYPAVFNRYHLVKHVFMCSVAIFGKFKIWRLFTSHKKKTGNGKFETIRVCFFGNDINFLTLCLKPNTLKEAANRTLKVTSGCNTTRM